jgi:uncharacterized membrane protein YeaQ/YmgE (transglycosylase-associated protein family)
MHILWTIIIGFIVGVIAKFLMPGDKYEPRGFILTAILGIVGAFVATYLGQAVGWYGPGDSAGIIGGVVGAVIVLVVYGFFAGRQGRATRWSQALDQAAARRSGIAADALATQNLVKGEALPASMKV